MRLLGAALVASALWAQNPVTVAYQCAEDDVQELGLSCSQAEPCAVFLELTSIDSVGNRILLAGNLHTSTTTVASILLASEDSGKTWTEPHPRLRGAALEQIQFLDFEAGWIGGQTVFGRPKDPFLLITHDGGKTWTQRPVFEESRAGAIEQFWFESRTSGSILIDRVISETGARHELYDTLTGGESWILVQASAAPLKLKRSRAGDSNTDLRIRADSRTRTYRIERRAADRWSALAAFPIQVGECKPADRILTEPPPEEPSKAEPKPEAPKTPATPPSLKKKRSPA